MSIEVKKPSESQSSVQAVRTLWSGLANFQVVGVKLDTSKEDTGVDKVRIDFELKNANNGIQTKITFWATDEPRISSKGKTEIINNLGQTAWTMEKDGKFEKLTDKMAWYDMSDVRAVCKGEGDITEFIFNWMNLHKKDNSPCRVADFKAFFKGDATQLEELVPQGIKDELVILLGVNDKGYQTTYNKFVSRSWYGDSQKKFTESLRDKFGQFKAEPFTTVTDESKIKQLLSLKEYAPAGMEANTSFETETADEADDLPF